jgi:hypothetical protein
VIIISGDSWGVGEWGTDPKTQQTCSVTGPGIGQYLSLHNKVVNLSEGGCGNTDSFLYLRTFLSRFKANEKDIFYFIVTDPLRNIESLTDINQGIEQAIRLQLDLVLTKLNQLATSHKIQINLIGGLCDLDTVDITSYNNLKIVVASWGKLLDKTYPTSIFCNGVIKNTIDTNKLDSVQLKEEWIKIIDQSLKKEEAFNKLRQQGLSYDGYHPNRYGHQILRNFLCPEYEHKF